MITNLENQLRVIEKELVSNPNDLNLDFNHKAVVNLYGLTSFQIRKKLKENYIRYTPNGAKKKFIIPHIIEKWQIAVKALFFIDARLFLSALKILGDIHLEFDDHEKAKSYYFYYKFLSFNNSMLSLIASLFAFIFSNCSKYLSCFL